MYKWKLLLCLCVALSYTSNCQSLSVKAKSAFDAKKYNEAIKIYSSLIKDNKASHMDLYYRGVAFYEEHKVQEAYNDFSACIDMAPDYPEAYFMRGSLLLVVSQIPSAINDLNMAIKYATTDTLKIASYVNRGSARLHTQNLEGCIKDCKEALKLDSLCRGALVNLATCYGYQKKHDISIPLLTRLYLKDSTDVAVVTNLGYELSQAEKYNESVYYFDRALKLNPNEAFVLSNKSYSFLKLGKSKEALSLINKSIELNPSNSYAYKNLGLIYLSMDQKTKACDSFNLALKKGFRDQYGPDVDELLKQNCN